MEKKSSKKFPNLSFKTVKKVDPKEAKWRKKRQKTPKIVVQKFPNLSVKTVKKVDPKNNKDGIVEGKWLFIHMLL